MLPHDVARCAGRAPFSGDTCPRKNECVRYLAESGPRSPFYLSVCEEGEAFIHAATLPADDVAGNPASTSPIGTLTTNTLRTDGGLA